jgi:hypothetical protein
VGFPPLDPRVSPRVFPPAILYDAYVYVNTRNAHGMEMTYGEHECLHMNEYFLLLFYRVGADLLFSYYSHNKQDMHTYTQVNQSNILVAYVNFKLSVTNHTIRSQISPRHVKVPWMTYINLIKLYLASILKRIE